MVQRQYGAIPSQVREQLASLERIVKQLLQSACAAGKTYIITNASEGWVQHSSTLCMPGLAEDLEKVRLLECNTRPPSQLSFPCGILVTTMSFDAIARRLDGRLRSFRPVVHSKRSSLATAMRGRCMPSCKCKTSSSLRL
jgi:hypothetical protein